MPFLVTSEMLDTTAGGGVVIAVCVAAFYVYCKLPQWRGRRARKADKPGTSVSVKGKRARAKNKRR